MPSNWIAPSDWIVESRYGPLDEWREGVLGFADSQLQHSFDAYMTEPDANHPGWHLVSVTHDEIVFRSQITSTERRFRRITRA